VIDLVYRAKVSVAKWFEKGDGTSVMSPRSNPAYCYNWAFGGGVEPTVACIWHESLTIEGGRIVVRGNIRDLASRLEAVAQTVGEDASIRIGAREQAGRARQLDELVRQSCVRGSDEPERDQATGAAYVRDRAVRDAALIRAAGM
jgi:5-methylcytosine-specific restriction enzyme A